MSLKISQLSIVVTDQDAALKFYTEKVGWEKKTDLRPQGQARWVTVAPPGDAVELALYAVGTMPATHTPSPLRQVGNGSIALLTDDCLATYEAMRSRGVTFVAPPDTQAWGTYVLFDDPDGNRFTILQPKKW
jgi:predicted enzyme related to lactoylglutathione lyase